MTDDIQPRKSRFGPSLPEKGWVPAPRYIMRRYAILRWFSRLPRGCGLEIGCGAGALLVELAEMGFKIDGLESSQDAREIAQMMGGGLSGIEIHATPKANWARKFDYVLAFEVLEHIDDDLANLRTWVDWLKPGGRIVISVPAHAHKWTATDEWAGHYRRYDKADLINLVENSGVQILETYFYGFPLANVMEPLRNALYRRDLALQANKKVNQKHFQKTARSGVDRSLAARLFPLIDNLFGAALFRVFDYLQHATRSQPWGNGLLLIGERPYE